MSNQEHINTHKRWHKALDYLIADYMLHHKGETHSFLGMPVIQLMKWSSEQCDNPDEPTN